MSHQNSSSEVRKKQINHIKNCLPLLVQWTRICPVTIAVLSAKNVLSSTDEFELESIQNELKKNKEFYKIIQTREGFFDILKDAMKDSGQTGVLKLLNDFNIDTNSTYTARKYSRVPFDLNKLLDLKPSDIEKSLTIVTSFNTKITIEKLRETFDQCRIFCKSVDEFRNQISLQAYLNARHLIVSVTNFEELKTVVNDAINIIYDPAPRHFLVIIVTPHENCKLTQNHIKDDPSWRNYVEIKEDNMNWDDLSPAHKQHIRSKLLKIYKINFHEKLDKLLNGRLLAQLINDEGFTPFKKTIPEPLKYYINRKLISRNVISADIFQLQTSNTFVFTGISRSDLSKLIKNEKIRSGSSREQLTFEKIEVKFMIEDKPGHFDRLCNKIRKQSSDSESVHLLHRDSSKKLKWVKSVGEMEGVQKYIDVVQDTLSETDFLKLSTHSNIPVCLSDSPGMGKSVLLENIARKLSYLCPDKSIFFVSMVQLIHEMNKIRRYDSDAVTKALERMVCDCDMAREVLKFKLSSGTKISIELLLDGFDELETSNYKLALDIIRNIITSFKSVRLWVTSRPHFIAELENTLKTLSFNIQPFDDEDQIRFLTKYWRRDEMDGKKMNQFARTCLDTIKSSYSSAGKDIAGIPLQCRLIGEVYEKQAMEYSIEGKNSSLEDTFEVTSITHLFEKTIENRFKKYQEMNREKKLTRKELMHMHAGLGLNFLFPVLFEENLKILFSNQLHVEDILKFGILEATSTSEAPRFVHRTFAEYFVAWFLVSKIKGEGDTLQRYRLKTLSTLTNLLNFKAKKKTIWQVLTDFLFDEVLRCKEKTVRMSAGLFLKPASTRTSYKFANPVITYFLNFLLSNANPQVISARFNCYFDQPYFSSDKLQKIAMSCVNSDLLQIFQFLTALNLFDSEVARAVFDRDVLFLAVRHSNLQFVQEILTNFEEHHSFDINVQTMVLYLAVERGDFSILELFLNEKHLDKLVGNAKLLLHSCIAFSKNNSEDVITQKIEICKSLLHESQSLLEEEDELRRTPLLLHHVHVRLLITLVELGSDVTATDNAGDTLIHINFNGSRQLSNQDYESLLNCIPEKMLRRLVYVKAADGDVPPVRLLKQLDSSKNIIEKFKAVGFNFNYVTMDNYSFLAMAIKAGRSADTIETLISCGSDISWKKGQRNLLHIAVKYGNADAIRVLMEQNRDTHDVTSTDKNGLTPLDYAVQRSKYYNRYKTGKLLWKYGGKYNYYNEMGESWLHLCAQKADCDSVKLLFHLGNMPDCQDKNGNTPLHFGVKEFENRQNSMYDITKLLLENNANPNLINNLNETPFYSALKNTTLDIDTYNLLKSKTVVSWTEDVATHALKFAIRAADSLEVTEFHTLIQECLGNGADVNCKYCGNTALHSAVDTQNEGAVKLLVESGADSNLRNALQQTPFDRASLCTDKVFGYKIMKYLIENGADGQQRELDNRTILRIFELGDMKRSQSQLNINGNKPEKKYSIGGICNSFDEEATTAFTPDNVVLPLSPYAQSSKNREIMVDQDCSIPDVVRALKAGTFTLSDKWSAIGRELGMPHSQIKNLKQELVLNQITLDELMFELIEMWVAMQGKAATLKQLIYVLEKNGMREVAGSLRTSFLQSDINLQKK